MISLVRAGVVAALFAVAPLLLPQSASAAEKAFRNSELADSAVKLEGQIKSDAGTPTKPLPQIRRDADAAFSKNDFRAGMALLAIKSCDDAATEHAQLVRDNRQLRQNAGQLAGGTFAGVGTGRGTSSEKLRKIAIR